MNAPLVAKLCMLAAYLVITSPDVNRALAAWPTWLSASEFHQPFRDRGARLGRATNHEDGVLSSESSGHLWPSFGIDRFGDRLRPAGQCVEDDELADTV